MEANKSGRNPSEEKVIGLRFRGEQCTRNSDYGNPTVISMKFDAENVQWENSTCESDDARYKKFNDNCTLFSLNSSGVEEERLFEEDNIECLEKPTITFSHVCTVEGSDQISFDQIRKSRSPSPLLEVPAIKTQAKQAVRPPL